MTMTVANLLFPKHDDMADSILESFPFEEEVT